jgi:hypothetical protein
MRYAVAHVKNISLLSDAGEALIRRAPGVPGIAVIWADTGAGKTTAAAWFANRVNAVYVRALATWTPSSMLGAILRELDVDPLSRCSDMVNKIAEELALKGRPLFVDEADHVISSKRLVETLRDLHDLSSSPLLLIGMADFMRQVKLREQLAGRVAQWVHFQPASLADARTLADAVCEVEISDDLLERLRSVARGSMRGLTVGLYKIEAFAKRTGKARVTAKDWGNRELTFTQARMPGVDGMDGAE